MKLQNDLMERLCDKQSDHIIETILVKDEKVLSALPEHFVDFMEVLVVPKSLQCKKSRPFSIRYAKHIKSCPNIFLAQSLLI